MFMFSVANLIIAEIMYRGVTGWPVINEPKWILKPYCPDLKVLYSSHNLIWRRCAAHLKCSTVHNFFTIFMWTGWVLTAASLSPTCEEQQEGSLFYSYAKIWIFICKHHSYILTFLVVSTMKIKYCLFCVKMPFSFLGSFQRIWRKMFCETRLHRWQAISVVTNHTKRVKLSNFC